MKIRFLTLAFCLITTVIWGQPETFLTPCPNSPNCVSTIAKKKQKQMQAIDYTDFKVSKEILLEVLTSMEEPAEVLKNEGSYLHVAFTTKVGGFVDDVEFYFDEASKKIHFRSASRTGYYDFNKNKRRLKKIIERYRDE